MQTECSDILSELESWYASPGGEYLLETTRAAVQGVLDTAFGYHILQLGLGGAKPLLRGSCINHKMFSAERSGADVNLLAHPDELPLDSHSVDAVIVHHCLEFARNPHKVLREIQRVLTPQGQLLVIGINPYSILGLHARARALMRDPLWLSHRAISHSRLTDWLHLLDCAVHETTYVAGLPPFGSGRFRRAMTTTDEWIAEHNMPVGGLYVLHASNQVAGLNRTRRRFVPAGARLSGLVTKPTPVPVPASPAQRKVDSFKKGSTTN